MAHIRSGKHKRTPRTDRSGTGERIYKRAEVKVIIGGKLYRHNFVAPARRGYNEKDREDIIEKAVEYLEKTFPLIEFRFVERGPNKFSFIDCGVREPETHAWPSLKKSLGLEGDSDGRVTKEIKESGARDTGESLSHSGTRDAGAGEQPEGIDASLPVRGDADMDREERLRGARPLDLHDANDGLLGESRDTGNANQSQAGEDHLHQVWLDS